MREVSILEFRKMIDDLLGLHGKIAFLEDEYASMGLAVGILEDIYDDLMYQMMGGKYDA